jgi:hypothetical protein
MLNYNKYFMSIGKAYFDIITSDSVVNISTGDIGDHNHAKIKVDGLVKIFFIDISDKIVINHTDDTLSCTFDTYGKIKVSIY